MKIGSAIAGVILSLAAGGASASDSCSDFLPYARGIDVLVKSGSRSQQSASALVSMLKTINLDEKTMKAAAEGADGPITGSANYEESQRRLNSLESLATSSGEHSEQARDDLYEFAENLPKYAVDAFNNCMHATGPHYTLVPNPDGEHLSIGLGLVAPMSNSPPLRVNSLTTGSISCPKDEVMSWKINPGSTRFFECLRPKGEAGLITIGSNYMPQNGGDILKVPEIPKSRWHIEKRQYDIHFCPTPGCAPQDRLFAFNIVQNPPSCSVFPTAGGSLVAEGEKIYENSQPTITAVEQLGTVPFSAIHFNPVQINGNSLKVCGWRDPPFAPFDGLNFLYQLNYEVVVRDPA